MISLPVNLEQEFFSKYFRTTGMFRWSTPDIDCTDEAAVWCDARSLKYFVVDGDLQMIIKKF